MTIFQDVSEHVSRYNRVASLDSPAFLNSDNFQDQKRNAPFEGAIRYCLVNNLGIAEWNLTDSSLCQTKQNWKNLDFYRLGPPETFTAQTIGDLTKKFQNMLQTALNDSEVSSTFTIFRNKY